MSVVSRSIGQMSVVSCQLTPFWPSDKLAFRVPTCMCSASCHLSWSAPWTYVSYIRLLHWTLIQFQWSLLNLLRKKWRPTYIINFCIEQDHFPKLWRMSLIAQIPKRNSFKTNYDLQGISILPTLYEVYERLALKQIVDFSELKHLLPARLSSFRKCHSEPSVQES